MDSMIMLNATRGVPPSMDLCPYSLILLLVLWSKIYGEGEKFTGGVVKRMGRGDR